MGIEQFVFINSKLQGRFALVLNLADFQKGTELSAVNIDGFDHGFEGDNFVFSF